MTSAILIAFVAFVYFGIAVDQFCIQHNFWNGLIWLGYAVAQVGLWHITIYGKV